jgi:hypothetical protein
MCITLIVLRPSHIGMIDQCLAAGPGLALEIAQGDGGGGTEVDDFHTSCSAPLEIGDKFGNLVLVAFDDQPSSATVTYRPETAADSAGGWGFRDEL